MTHWLNAHGLGNRRRPEYCQAGDEEWRGAWGISSRPSRHQGFSWAGEWFNRSVRRDAVNPRI